MTAAIRVEHRSAQTRIEPLQLPYRINTQLLLHIVPHLERDDLAAEAVHDRRHIQLAVRTLYLGNICEKLLRRALGTEVPFQNVFLLLRFCRGFRDSMRNASFMEPAILFHHAIHCPPADVNAILLKRKADAIHAVVSVIRMLFENLFDLSRKKLTAAVPAPVSKPPVITGLTQVQNTAHLLCRVDALAFDYEQVSFTRFYFLRSFAKKPSASLRMSFAVRSSAFSRSSSRMRIVYSSALSVFAGGVFRRMLRQSASV